MARNGSGTFSNPYPNFVSGTVISSTQVDANNSDIATALTQSIAVDGQSTVTGNLPMNAKKLTGLAVGAAATDSLNLGQAQAEAMVWCGTAGGSANAITLSPTPAITAYAAGQRFVWKASGSVNTGATTVAISGLGAIALQDNGSALAAGQHQANKIFMGILDTTSTVQVTQVQISGTDPLIVTSLTVSGTATVGGILSVDDTTTSTSGTTGSIHTDGGLGVAGTAFVAGAATVGGASQFNSTVTVGVNDTGYDVKLFGATSGKSLLWDESADSLIVTGTTTLVGTTNLDAVDIDGATQIDGTVTVGVNDTGYDVQFFGATSGAHMLWDESADDLKLVGAAGLTVAGNIDVDGTTNLDAVDIDGAVQIDATVTVGVNDTGYDVKFFGAASGAYLLYDESDDDLILKGGAPKLVIQDGLTDSFTSGAVSSSLSFQARNSDVRVLGQIDAVHASTNGTVGAMRFQTRHGDTLAERLRIDSSGAVGIATSVPAYKLDVSGTGRFTDSLRILTGATTTSGLIVGGDATAGNTWTIARDNVSTGDLKFIGGTTERMRISTSGNLLVAGTSFNANGSVCIGPIGTAANGCTAVSASTSATNIWRFYNPNGNIGTISVSGTATTYATSSDYRLKEDAQPVEAPINRLKQLKPINFKWKVSGSRSDGFLAHEAQEIVPDAVTGSKDDLDKEGKPIYQGIDQSKLVPLLTAALQEAVAKIEALETRITALEG